MSPKRTALAEKGSINKEASIKDLQSVIVQASDKHVWDILTHPENWPKWNQRVSGVKISDIDNFSWKEHNTKFKSRVHHQIELKRISWTSTSSLQKCITVWSIEKTEKNQCIVTVEQSIQGLVAAMIKSHHGLHTELLNWLSSLKHEAEKRQLASSFS